MTKTQEKIPSPAEETANRYEDEPIFEEGFTPVSHVTVVKKNQRYVAVASKNLKPNELIEKCGFAPTPYKTNEPDQRAKLLANFLPVAPCSCQQCLTMGPTIIIPTGNMIFYQFSTKANTEIQFDGENGTITLRASYGMKKGDELFIDYSSLYPQATAEQEALYRSPNELPNEMTEEIMRQSGLMPER
jgi:hypothetical protein|tara:strand:- start:5116 stop:5679 length:564 start_codon:yes stop_codon:yes gene_type:complete